MDRTNSVYKETSWKTVGPSLAANGPHEPRRNIMKKISNKCDLQVLLQYSRQFTGHLIFKYDHTDTTWINVDTIISTVILEYNFTTIEYTLDSNNDDALNEFVSSKNYNV